MLEWFAREKVLTKAFLINLALFVMAEFVPLPPEAASRPILNLEFALAVLSALVLLMSIRYIRGNEARSRKRPNVVSELGVWGYIWREIVAALACVFPSFLFPKGNPILFQVLCILVAPIVVCLLYCPNRLLFVKNLLRGIIGVPVVPLRPTEVPAKVIDAKPRGASLAWLFVAILGVFLWKWFDNGEPQQVERIPTELEYSSAQDLDYRRAMLGEISKGVLVSMPGQIRSVSEGSAVLYRKEPKSKGFFCCDEIHLSFKGRLPVIKEDIVHIFGRYEGLVTFAGGTSQMPSLWVDYYRVDQPKK